MVRFVPVDEESDVEFDDQQVVDNEDQQAEQEEEVGEDEKDDYSHQRANANTRSRNRFAQELDDAENEVQDDNDDIDEDEGNEDEDEDGDEDMDNIPLPLKLRTPSQPTPSSFSHPPFPSTLPTGTGSSSILRRTRFAADLESDYEAARERKFQEELDSSHAFNNQLDDGRALAHNEQQDFQPLRFSQNEQLFQRMNRQLNTSQEEMTTTQSTLLNTNGPSSRPMLSLSTDLYNRPSNAEIETLAATHPLLAKMKNLSSSSTRNATLNTPASFSSLHMMNSFRAAITPNMMNGSNHDNAIYIYVPVGKVIEKRRIDIFSLSANEQTVQKDVTIELLQTHKTWHEQEATSLPSGVITSKVSASSSAHSASASDSDSSSSSSSSSSSFSSAFSSSQSNNSNSPYQYSAHITRQTDAYLKTLSKYISIASSTASLSLSSTSFSSSSSSSASLILKDFSFMKSLLHLVKALFSPEEAVSRAPKNSSALQQHLLHERANTDASSDLMDSTQSNVGITGVPDESSIDMRLGRRQAIIHWLTSTVRESSNRVFAELESERVRYKDDPERKISIAAQQVFLALTCGDFYQAIQASASIGDTRLALLLSLASSPASLASLQKDVAKQVAFWKQNGQWNFFTADKQDIYELLAGNPNVKGQAPFWLDALTLNVLYSATPLETNVAQAVHKYEEVCYKAGPRESTRLSFPHPHYPVRFFPTIPREIKNGLSHFPVGPQSVAKCPVYLDARYALLQLWASKYEKNVAGSETILLAPQSNNPFVLNCQFSFHLLSLLRHTQILSREDDTYQYKLIMDFATQLEMMGEWKWAIYVVLTAPVVDNAGVYSTKRKVHFNRLALTHDILSRHISYQHLPSEEHQRVPLVLPDLPEIESYGDVFSVSCKISDPVPITVSLSSLDSFLLDELSIPPTVLFSAKAQRAAYDNQLIYALHLYALAQDWNKVHELIKQHMLCELIILSDDNLVNVPALVNLLDVLQRNAASIVDWCNYGQIFWDFLVIHIKISDNSRQLVEKLMIEIRTLESTQSKLQQPITQFSQEQQDITQSSTPSLASWKATTLPETDKSLFTLAMAAHVLMTTKLEAILSDIDKRERDAQQMAN